MILFSTFGHEGAYLSRKQTLDNNEVNGIAIFIK
jgi:hypothetical protein